MLTTEFSLIWRLKLKVLKMKIAELAHSVNPDEVAHDEPIMSHLTWIYTVCLVVFQILLTQILLSAFWHYIV